MSPGARRLAALSVVAAFALLPAAPTAAADGPRHGCRERSPSLRCAAQRGGMRIGVGREAGNRAEDALAVREFDSMTLENSLLWNVVHPAPGRWDWRAADRSVAWARRHHMYLTATHFVWDQIVYQSTPAWVKEITDPARLRAVMADHLRTITRRYGRGIDRWITVNEPLRYFGDTGAIQENHLSRVLGPDWIAETFRIAHRAAPHAEQWLNEVFAETDAVKSEALVELARSLVARHVPIDGVGLQGHLFTPYLQPAAPRTALVARTLRRLAALGIRVSFTEVDAPTLPTVPNRLAAQARRVRSLVRTCVAVRRCTGVTFWNLQDARSWLNNLFGRSDLAPTLFDARLRPKPAYVAVRKALVAARGRPRAPERATTRRLKARTR